MVQFAQYATIKRFKTWLNLKAGAQIYNSLHKSKDIGGYGDAPPCVKLVQPQKLLGNQ